MTKWYRNIKKGKLGGICAGLSEMWNVDVTLIRFAWFLMIWTPVPAVIGYVIAWFIVPDKEEIHADNISTRTTTTSSAGSKEFLAG